ncbi:hypothetical protein A2U01_0111385, partial [Trifolium medium]|nr:hypothetical protein [Trifolium medium]
VAEDFFLRFKGKSTHICSRRAGASASQTTPSTHHHPQILKRLVLLQFSELLR